MPSTQTSMLDGLSTSVAVKAPCAAVALSNITLSGEQTISSVACVEGDRVLVTAQTNAVDNGIYVVSTGQWQRALDADGNRDLVQGTLVLVRNGVADGAMFELTTENPIVIDTSELVFELRNDTTADFPQTLPEIAAGVVPANTSIPSHDVTGRFDLRRYGAAQTYSALVDDLPFWNTAISVINATANKTGTITGACRTYRINGTLTISTNVGIDFGPSSNGLPTQGMTLFSDTNAPILVFDTPAVSRFIEWSNFTICGTSVRAGTGSAKVAQHGLTINNRGVWMRNVSIRACGGIGLRELDSNGSQLENFYISLCDGVGHVQDVASSGNVGASVGANNYLNISTTNNGSHGRHIISADGRSRYFGCDSEQNAGAGRKFGANVVGNQEWGGHSELNVGGSIVWDATSNHNVIDLIWGDSGGVDLKPVNNGSIGNRWTGQEFASGGGGFNTERVGPKLVDYKQISYADFASSAPNPIPFDDTAPQASGEGATRMSLSYVPKQIGNRVRIFGQVAMSISAGTHAIAALFNNQFSATDACAAEAVAVAVDTLVVIPFSAEFTITSLNSLSLNVNIGSNAAATVRFNGISARVFGAACTKSWLRVEEFFGIP